MKIIGLIVVFSATWHSYGQGQDFAMIFASNRIFSKNTISIGNSTNLYEAKELTTLSRDVTGLARYKSYLYSSVKRSSVHSTDSGILRANFNSTSIINEDSWENFAVVNDFGDDILCMVIVKGHIFAGRSKGTIWYCSADEPSKCQILRPLKEPDYPQQRERITGIDYSPSDGKIYASSSKGILLRLEENANSWNGVSINVKMITTLKIEFNAIWLGVRLDKIFDNTRLMKCPLWKDGTLFNENDCQFFENQHSSLQYINSIDATNGYLYYNLWGGNVIYRCNPEKQSSCRHLILRPVDMEKFIMV